MSTANFPAFFQYLGTLHQMPFKWGAHDCVTFTNTAFRILHGQAWCRELEGEYMAGGRPMSKTELQAKFGFTTFAEFMAPRMMQVRGVPARGDLVATAKPDGWCAGISLGICLGSRCVYLAKVGLEHQPVEDIKAAWALWPQQ